MRGFFGTGVSLSGDAYAIMHMSRLTAEMVVCVESQGDTRLAPDLSDAALQVGINAQELDAEARRVREIADALSSPMSKRP